MVDWREIVENRDWDELEQWLGENAFRCSTDDAAERKAAQNDRSAVLEWLQDNAPRVTTKNGIETLERYVTYDEAPDEWKGAVKILELGELEASILGEPPTDTDTWKKLRPNIARDLEELAHAQEAPEGDDALSQRGRALTALRLLGEVDKIMVQVPREMTDESDARWITEVISGVAHNAFLAGRHLEAALKKPFEKIASSKMREVGRNQTNAKKGGKTKLETKAERIRTLDRLAKNRIREFVFVEKREAVRIAKKLVVEFDKGADDPVFTERGQLLSNKWFEEWWGNFRINHKKTMQNHYDTEILPVAEKKTRR